MSIPARGLTGVWTSTVRDRRGRVKYRGRPHANLRTDSGDDWQSNMMTGGPTNNVPARAATSISTTTTLNDTGAAFPTAANVTGLTGGLCGRIVACGPNSSGTGSTVYGVIITNTATSLTVDRWVAAGSPFTAGTTPNGTCNYQVLPGNAPAWFLALGSTDITPAVTDVTLTGEITTGGLSRTQATTITHTLAAATYSLAATFTASATLTVNQEAVFNASGTAGVTATTGGVMAFENDEPSPPTLVSLDTLTQTCSVSY